MYLISFEYQQCNVSNVEHRTYSFILLVFTSVETITSTIHFQLISVWHSADGFVTKNSLRMSHYTSQWSHTTCKLYPGTWTMKRNYTDIALSEATLFHMELFICYGIETWRQASFLKVWITHKERCLQQALHKHFNLPVIKYKVHKYPVQFQVAHKELSVSYSATSIWFHEFQEQVPDIPFRERQIRSRLALRSPIISLCLALKQSLYFLYPKLAPYYLNVGN